MRAGLIAAAAAGILVNVAFGLRSLDARTAAGSPGAIHADPTTGFARRLLGTLIPPAAFVFVAMAVLWRAESYSAVASGLLLTSMATAIVVPPLGGTLLLWSHDAVHVHVHEEAGVLPRIRRLGVLADELWIAPTPIVTFWRPPLLCPAIIVGRRILMWQGIRGMPPERLAGIALGPAATFWLWAVWPLGIGAAFRLADSTSALPWWLFGVAAGLIVLTTLPGLVRALRIHNALRTDASAPDAIRGSVEIGAVEASLVAGRGTGALARFGSRSVWDRVLRRARRAGSRAGMRPADIRDATQNELIDQ